MNPKPWPAEIGNLRETAICTLRLADERLIDCRQTIYRNPTIALTALWQAIVEMQEAQIAMVQAAQYTPPSGRWPSVAKDARDHTTLDLEELIPYTRSIKQYLNGNTDKAFERIEECRSLIRVIVRRLEQVT